MLRKLVKLIWNIQKHWQQKSNLTTFWVILVKKNNLISKTKTENLESNQTKKSIIN
jgi:hypothetical protein